MVSNIQIGIRVTAQHPHLLTFDNNIIEEVAHLEMPVGGKRDQERGRRLVWPRVADAEFMQSDLKIITDE